MVAISAPPPNSVYAVKSLHVFKLFADVRARLEPREDCPNVCANNLYDDYYYSYLACDKSTSCLDSCCPTGQKCDGGVCKTPPPPDPCKDNDNDGYKGLTSTCKAPIGTDCDDANANINPGAVDVCGNGVDEDCDGQIDEGCAVCGDSKVTGSEGCDVWQQQNAGLGVKFTLKN